MRKYDEKVARSQDNSSIVINEFFLFFSFFLSFASLLDDPTSETNDAWTSLSDAGVLIAFEVRLSRIVSR